MKLKNSHILAGLFLALFLFTIYLSCQTENLEPDVNAEQEQTVDLVKGRPTHDELETHEAMLDEEYGKETD
jgi:hypothetical protein